MTLLRFKNFLLSEARNPDEDLEVLTFLENMDSDILKIDAQSQINKNKTTGNKIVISMYVQPSQRANFVEELLGRLKKDKTIKILGGRFQKDILFSKKGIQRTILADVKPAGKDGGKKVDPNELMTAAFTMSKDSLENITTIDDLDNLIAEGVKNAKNVVGFRQIEIDKMSKDFANATQAVSAARSIRKWMGGKPDKAWITGKVWDGEISKFKRKAFGMKDFNSSDLVFKRGKTFYGVSLKKKDSSKQKDPTILNKSFRTIFNDPSLSKFVDKVNVLTDIFYNKIIGQAIRGIKDGKIKPKDKVLGINKKQAEKIKLPLKNNQWKTYIKDVNNDFVNKKLKGNESLFKDINKVLIQNRKFIADILIQLVLKLDLKDLRKEDFEFSLVTGIGRILKSGPVIEKADLKDLPSIVEVMDDIFAENKKINISLDKNQTQAFDKNATSATLYYNLTVGKINLLEISIRYKGNFSNQPSFLATLHDDFKAILKKKEK